MQEKKDEQIIKDIAKIEEQEKRAREGKKKNKDD